MALNSFTRGFSAFIGTEATVPIQDSLGDGWFYTLFAITLLFAGAMTLAVLKWGEHWREKGVAKEEEREKRKRDEFGSSAATAVDTPALIVHGSVSVARPGSPVAGTSN